MHVALSEMRDRKGRLKRIFTDIDYTVIQRLCIEQSRHLHTHNLSSIYRIYYEHNHLMVQELGFRITCDFYIMYALQKRNDPNTFNARANQARFPLYLKNSSIA